MRRQQLVPYCCLVALLLLGAAIVAAPAAADGTATTAPDARTLAQSESNQTYDDTAITDIARTDDGSLYLTGISSASGLAIGSAGGNATLIKQAPDGSSAWTRTFEANETSVLAAVEPGPDDDVYAVQLTYNRSDTFSPPNLSLLRIGADGTVQWRESLPGGSMGSRQPLTVTETGVVVANRTRSGLELFRYGADGDREWRESYDVNPDQVSIDVTEDGYRLAGTVDFESPWVMRLDDAGRIQSNQTYPSTEIGQVADAVPTPDGGIVLVGTGGGFGGTTSPVAVGIGPDDSVRWSRAIGSGGVGRIGDVLSTDDGFLLVGSEGVTGTGPTETTLTGVSYDGAVQYQTRVPGLLQPAVTSGPDSRITLAGLSTRTLRTPQSAVRTVALPTPDSDASATLAADAGLDSGATHYRGQNLRIQAPRQAGETVEIVALSGEYDDFEPHVTRHVTLDRSGQAVVETATLATGRYVVEIDGEPALLESGSVVTTRTREAASFTLDSHDIYGSGLNRDEGQFVDRAAGEETATLAWDSSRDDYVAQVSVSRFRGDQVTESTLERFLGDAEGFTGTTTSAGTPVALVESDEEMQLDASATALEAGLYDVRISGSDTSEVGDATTTRLVVGTAERRPLSVETGDDSLQVAVGNETERNVTVSGVTQGVAAASMSANLTGQPSLDLDLGVQINGSRASAGAGHGPGYTDASATALGGTTANGTITLGTVGIQAEPRRIDPDGNTTNTVTFQIDWVVDERGIPYTVPDPMEFTVDVTNIEDATGESHERPPRPPRAKSSG